MNNNPFNIKNLGLVINPAAGAGREFIEKTAAIALEKFRDCSIVQPGTGISREETAAAVLDIACKVDAILVIGGDGTMSDVAYSLYMAGVSTPVIGIGAGSTNAGPLITLQASGLDRLDRGAFTVEEAGGILACVNGEEIGLGFNDVVLGDTVLTTLEGKVVQVSASDYMIGKKNRSSPLKVGTCDSIVRIKRQGKIVEVHRGIFGQLFAAPLEERYRGKGLAGGTSLATALGLPAGIAITSEPLVNFSIRAEELLKMEPITTKTSSFREGDIIIINGLREGTCVNIDGNPLDIIGPRDEVRMKYISSAAKLVKMSHRT